MKDDQRVALTKRLLKEGLFRLLQTKDIGKVGVTELCRESGINRATFYRHFEQPRDILNEIRHDLFCEIKRILNSGEAGEESLKKIEDACTYIYENAELINILSGCRTDAEFVEFMSQTVASECPNDGITTDDFAIVLRGGVSEIGSFDVCGEDAPHLGQSPNQRHCQLFGAAATVAAAFLVGRSALKTESGLDLSGEQGEELFDFDADVILNRGGVQGRTTIESGEEDSASEGNDFLKRNGGGQGVAVAVRMIETRHLFRVGEFIHSLVQKEGVLIRCAHVKSDIQNLCLFCQSEKTDKASWNGQNYEKIPTNSRILHLRSPQKGFYSTLNLQRFAQSKRMPYLCSGKSY